eukprot:CAMPEP_0167757156 /NCGR_PEP_ID=MMETSP0110_2-20121227/9772_1 /TAXON_ID=629695 /ORGANISM="Gymnochlora sp., Strain CCMP2014" /LENGTH=333 /DNA_ID=CAMNT_0007643321 /DNA_START=48 /DNA_END=1049 /DNA_ORIENTATION=-
MSVESHDSDLPIAHGAEDDDLQDQKVHEASAPPLIEPGEPADELGGQRMGGDDAPAQNLFEVDMAITSVVSLIELTAAGKYCHDTNSCKNQSGFAVSVGVLGFVFAVAYLIMLRVNAEFLVSINGLLGMINLVFWGIAVGILTFDRPFTATGNGYFAIWAGFIVACHFTYHAVPRLQDYVNRLNEGAFQLWSRKVLLVILIASIVEVFAAANACANSSCTKYFGWAVACGTISAVYIAVLLLLPTYTTRFLYVFSTLLFIWWCIGAASMTYDQPFPSTGNGYFACWVAVLGSFYLMYFALFGSAEEGDGQQAYKQQETAYQDANASTFPSAEL